MYFTQIQDCVTLIYLIVTDKSTGGILQWYISLPQCNTVMQLNSSLSSMVIDNGKNNLQTSTASSVLSSAKLSIDFTSCEVASAAFLLASCCSFISFLLHLGIRGTILRANLVAGYFLKMLFMQAPCGKIAETLSACWAGANFSIFGDGTSKFDWIASQPNTKSWPEWTLANFQLTTFFSAPNFQIQLSV